MNGADGSTPRHPLLVDTGEVPFVRVQGEPQPDHVDVWLNEKVLPDFGKICTVPADACVSRAGGGPLRGIAHDDWREEWYDDDDDDERRMFEASYQGGFFLSPRAAVKIYLALELVVSHQVRELPNGATLADEVAGVSPDWDVTLWMVELIKAYFRVKSRLLKGASMVYDCEHCSEDFGWNTPEAFPELWSKTGAVVVDYDQHGSVYNHEVIAARRGYGSLATAGKTGRRPMVESRVFPGNPNCLAEVYIAHEALASCDAIEQLLSEHAGLREHYESLPQTPFDDVTEWAGGLLMASSQPSAYKGGPPWYDNNPDEVSDMWQNWFVPMDPARVEDHYFAVHWHSTLHRYFPAHFQELVWMVMRLSDAARAPKLWLAPAEIWFMILGFLTQSAVAEPAHADRLARQTERQRAWWSEYLAASV
jgi:hypothetical protein